MRIDFAAFSNLGPRTTNEDRFLEPIRRDAPTALIAIADGMGGAAGGGEAASLAIAAAKRIGPDLERLDQIFFEAANAIRQRAEQTPELARMGTTLSLAAISSGIVHVAHVGDTRIYHLRDRGLKSLTQDQTEIAELVRRGVFTESQARRYPRRNVLLSALTAKGEYEIYRAEAALQPGDRLVLMSDGVHQQVKRGSILNASLAHTDVSDFVSEIERSVLAGTPTDNFTALALEIREL